jgi:hypothetical protein
MRLSTVFPTSNPLSNRWLAVPVLLLLVAAVLSAALFPRAGGGLASMRSSGSSGAGGAMTARNEAASPPVAAQDSVAGAPGRAGGVAMDSPSTLAAGASAAGASKAAPQAAPSAPSAAVSGQALPPLPSVDRMIVKNGALTLRVTDLAAAVQRVNGVVAGIPGAFVASSSTSYRADPADVAGVSVAQPRDGVMVPPRPIPSPAPGQTATISIKVPADSFGDAMQRLRDLGTPMSENVSTQEVTEEYVDLEAQVRNLEATEQQYLRLMERAQRIEEILPIQQRLTEVRSQIERLRGRMTLLQRRADSSTITVSLVLPGGRASLDGEPRAVRTLREAFSGLLVALSGLLDVLIYLGVYAIPVVPFALFYLWLRSRRTAGPSGAAPAAGGAV